MAEAETLKKAVIFATIEAAKTTVLAITEATDGNKVPSTGAIQTPMRKNIQS